MRITNSMLKRNYLRTMNNNMTNLAKSNEKMSSQRSFSRTSENVSDANRALRVRRQLLMNEQSSVSIRDAGGKFAAAEDNLRSLNKTLQDVSERMIQGMNGTLGEEDKAKIAREIVNMQEEVLQVSNMQYNDNFLFGASGNADGKPPFTVTDGVLSYNGTPVDTMKTGTGANLGMPVIPDPADPLLEIPVPFNKDSYIDVGLGFTVNGEGANAKLDTKTAVKSTISGISALGYGTNAEGVPKNLYSLLGRIAEDLGKGDTEALGKDLTQMRASANTLLMEITDLGNRSNFLTQIGERLDNDTLNLQTVQNELEAVPIQEEVIQNKDFEMSWMITLQMGSKILPASIFDFLR